MIGRLAEDSERSVTTYHVALAKDHGWDVFFEERGTIVSVHCSDWHRVERLCKTLDRQQWTAPRCPRRGANDGRR